MNLNDLQFELKKNNIDEKLCLINSRTRLEGALCINQELSNWKVTLIERGEYLIRKEFDSEHEACRYFLKHVLMDPTYKKDFKQSDLIGFWERARQVLREYGYDTDEL